MAMLKITFLGQMGFRIKFADTVLYVDPFLSPHPKRLFSPPILVEELNDTDLFLGTHDHKDHIDRDVWPLYATASPHSRFVVPELLLRRGLAADLKIPAYRFSGLTHLQTLSVKGVDITAVASAHELLDKDEETGLYPYLGYVIKFPEYTIYHAGDTCRYEGLEAILKKWNFDVMILPINGRDATRYAAGCFGNMTYQEAADLSGVLKPRVVIPGHYDMFAHNAEDPDHFVEYMRVKYPNQRVSVMVLGENFVIQGG